MSKTTYEPLPNALPSKGEVWKHRYNGKHYAFVGYFIHDPKTCKPRDYIIVQIYGNYTNEVEIIEVAAWFHLFDLAWGPLIECQFCGFRRMTVCTKRQTCPNLSDYRLEDDVVEKVVDTTPEEEDAIERAGFRRMKRIEWDIYHPGEPCPESELEE